MRTIGFGRARKGWGGLSNFKGMGLVMEGEAWPSVEHWYQAQKLADAGAREEVRLAAHAAAAKRLAYELVAAQGGLPADWETQREAVMLEALRAKFGQNEAARALLLATGEAPVAEFTKSDDVWGVLPDGTGQNLLGVLLMQVRAELRAELAPDPLATRENALLLRWVIRKEQGALRWQEWLTAAPPHWPGWTAEDGGAAPVAERVAGMLLGLQIGDALGNTSESQNPDERAAKYGEIRDYLPNRHAGGAAVGLPSDDTQLTLWTLEQLRKDGRLVPEHMAQRLCEGEIYGIGSTVAAWRRAFCAEGEPWFRAGQPSAGNGALMRVAAHVVPYAPGSGAGLGVDAALGSLITHNDGASTGVCVAAAGMLWALLRRPRGAVPEPGWWLDRYVQVAEALETGKQYTPKGGAFVGQAGPLWRLTADWVQAAWAEGKPVRAACNEWYSGAYLLETWPSVLYILMRYAHDPEEALVRAVNDTRDNDTVAAVVGAMVGALHGVDALPARWRVAVSGWPTATE